MEKATPKIQHGNNESQKKVSDLQKVQSALKVSEAKLNALLLSIPDHITLLDKDLTIIWANDIAQNDFGENIIGKKCHEIYHRREEPCEPYPCLTLKAFEDGQTHSHETQVIDKDGKIRFFHRNAAVALRDENNNPTAVIEVSRDITKQKQAQAFLKEASKELEKKLEARTFELNDTLERLEQDERQLLERKAHLEKLNKELIETNQAVSVLARNIDNKKEQLEKKIVQVIHGKVLPILNKLQKDASCQRWSADLEVVVDYLYQITQDSSPAYELGSCLTDQEMRVAIMIKNGLSSQQMSDLMSLSLYTIKAHRKNIRKKLKICGKRINLASYLKAKLKSHPA